MTVQHRIWGRTLTGATAAAALLALLAPDAVAQGVGIGPYHIGQGADTDEGRQEPGKYRFKGTVWNPKSLPDTPSVGSHSLQPRTTARVTAQKALPRYRAATPTWPAVGTSTLSLTRSATATKRSTAAGASSQPVPVSRPVKAGHLPVWVAPAPTVGGGAKTASAATPSSVRVRMTSHAQALRAGTEGMLLDVTRTDGGTGTGKVQVVIDYSSIAKAYGGGYGSRLRLVQLPSCALTTPQLAACRTRTPIRFTNRPGADQLTATLTLTSAGAKTKAGTVSSRAATAAQAQAMSTAAVAVTAGSSGSQGNYAATSLSPSGAWQASGTGAFTYSYPIDIPSAVGGNTPSVSLGYDSQTVDGETSARNSQASSIGDGWNYTPGFVERTYRSCGSLLDSDGNKLLKGSGDECWGGANAAVSFGAHSGVLVPDGKDSGVPGEIRQWRLQGDDGTVVQELSGAANGLQDGTYFRVLTTDGTAAYFGSDHAPGGVGTVALPQSGTPSDDSTDAAWGVPVLHPQSGDPCYDSGKGKASRCDDPEGWRWNLDFVVSPHGFVQRYDYSTEKNYYDLGGGQAASDSSGTLTPYTRGGALTSISYGYTLDDELAARTPAAKVTFTSAQRCQTTSSFTDCSAGNLTDDSAPHWPDVPWDLHCDSTDKTKLPDGATKVPTDVCVTSSPTFWSTTRLDTIATEVHVKDSTTDKFVPVDSYALGQVYSDAGGAVDPVTGTTVDPKDAGSLQAVMWLQTIQHTGKDTYGNGNSDITQNKVAFSGTEIDNRVNDFEPAAPPLYRPRISSVQTETGESVAVDYNQAPCADKTLSMSMADSNTNSCYPTYWTVPGDSKPTADWFNKVTVRQVVASDLTIASQYNPDAQKVPAGSEAQVSTYSYSGPAWHRDDSEQTDDQYRTWDQFRGFRTVTVKTGAAPEPVTQQTTTYLQGMDGDYKADGSRRSVTVAAKAGGDTVQLVTDSAQLAGTPLEMDSYTKADGTVDAETVNGPFGYTATAHAAQKPWTDWTQGDNPGASKPDLSTLPDLTAHRATSAQQHQYALLTDGTWRHTRTDTTYDDQGRPSTVDSHGDVSVPTQEKCTTTTYAAPPSTNPAMIAYPDRMTTVSGPCGTAVSAATLLSDKEIYYNGDGTLTNLGTYGQLDQSGHNLGTPVAAQASAVRTATGFSSGTETWRTTAAMAYDGAGRITDALDAAGHTTHTDFSPAWSDAGGNTNPVGSTSANTKQWKTISTLDPLRGLPTENIDTNGRKTDVTYDALGRRTAVWLPGRDKTAGQSASMTFAYSVNPGAVSAPGGTITQPGDPSAVTTRTLREDGTYSTSITLYDGMLQPRQTQETADGDSDSGRIISDSFYDSHGWPTIAYAPYSEPANGPSATLYAANENEVPSETTTDYDGQGRPAAATLWHQAIQQWKTTTSYPGADEIDTTAPAGGPSTATFTNALGQTTKSVVRNTAFTVTLKGGQVIPSGTSLTSDSVRLTMQADGNLVLSALNTGKTVWASGTAGNPGAFAQFGTDGNLSVSTTTGTTLWTSGLTATTGATMELRNDSTLDIVSSGGTALWHQGTADAVPAAHATTRYTYTPAGQVDTVKDNAGNTWSNHYNFEGEKTSQTDPNLGTATFDQYDVLGNLLQMTDPRGQVLSYTYDWDNRVTDEYAAAWSANPDPAKKLANRVYDTLANGYPTSSTRYVGGVSGKAYTETVTGYNTAYQPLGTSVTIPAADGFAAAGQTSAPTSGSVTYTTTASYTPTVGHLSTTRYQADGNLPAESVDYGYTQQGNLDAFGGYINNANTPSYLDIAVHDPFGRIKQANYGPTGKELATFSQYDATTGRSTQTSSMLQTSATALDVVNYRYNRVGELTAADDLQNNTIHDTQCFTYDSFQRLTAAWTDTSGITDPTSAPVGNVGSCTTTSVQTTGTVPVKTSTVGGPAPYWQTYTYDLLGDRTGMVNHDTTGNALADTTQTINYPGTDGTAASTLPDQAGTTTTSNPQLGSATQTSGYTDPAYSNKNAGDTTSRKTATTGPLATGFTLSGGGKLCVDDASGSTTAGTKVQVYTCNGSTSQSWTIGTDGTVKVKGMCLDTTGNAAAAGTLVVIDTCSSDATQKWKATTTGTLVNNANTAVCLTDPAANATKGTQLTLATCGSTGQVWTTIGAGDLPPGQTQTLTYDAEGRTATVTTGTGATSNTSKYLYDADGNLLEQTSASGSTDKTRILYLFGGAEQITLNVSAKTFTGLRNYAGPDGTVITRSSSGSVAYQVGNSQGTATTAIDATSLAVTRRSFDPWGNPRGTKPTSWVAADENRGFLGQPADATTGLDLLGARNYDPALGRFLTPDPIFQAGDPNQMGGYTYAADNPASGSDPSGLCLDDGTGHCHHRRSTGSTGTTGSTGSTDNSSGATSAAPTPSTTPTPSSGPTPVSTQTPTPTLGETPCQPADFGTNRCESYGGGSLLITTGVLIVGLPLAGVCLASGVVECATGAVLGAADAEAGGSMLLGVRVAVGLGAAAARAFDEAAEDAAAEAGAAKKAAEDAAAADTAKGTAAKKADAQAHAESAEATATTADTPAKGASGTKPEKGCSFSPDTPVLMADGTSKPIGDVKPGDKVESADPDTGKDKGSRTVQATWHNHDHDLVDVTVDTGHGHTATLHTTSNHPFYDATTRAWIPAGKLTPGHTLTTPDGHRVHIKAVTSTRGTAVRDNLTVQQLHTYYVVAGSVPILVHNACGPDPRPGPAQDGHTLEDYANANRGHNQATTPDFVTEYTSPSGRSYWGRTQGDTEIEPGSALDDVLGANGRDTCSEICAMNEAQKAEGDSAIFGGSFRTLRVRPLGSPLESGVPFDPCEESCQVVIRKTFGTWSN
ncbi:ricin-type beta-trefoil lectin domain protein [Streptomyces mirabilis]|uniref:ricin-type beta-trefoil lectin domain protein n=1 Tax=Streptomyces mirabilis TaxID=68239 RepID=UPI001BAE5DD9|nr:ricin-type beta-trefoil lectin domain protein [Streptomyces mirabilis]QUW84476.1 ricin-type beta-trefoil lectin domain protein [Streptomyces mirabilis]